MHPWIVRIACLVLLTACTPLARAHIYRCVGAHGEPVFSGQPCGTPAPSQADKPAPSGRWGSVCAASPHALAQEITNAFQYHDVNLLAGLILWRGTDQTAARASLRSLRAWLAEPLADIAWVSGPGPPRNDAVISTVSGSDSPGPVIPSAASPTGVEVTTGGGDGSARSFGVTEIGSCWWLTF